MDRVYYKNKITARYLKYGGNTFFIVLALMGTRNFIRDKMLPGQLPEKTGERPTVIKLWDEV